MSTRVFCCAIAACALFLGAAPVTSAGDDELRVTALRARPALFTCGALAFPKDALAGPKGAESGADPAAAALSAFVRRSGYPKKGWRVLASSPEQVEFGHEWDARPSWLTVLVERGQDDWAVSENGPCVPERFVRRFSVGRWSLAKDVRLTPRTRTLRLRIRIGECERLDHVEVSYGRRSVNLLVLHRLERLPTAPGEIYICPSVTYVRVRTVRLPAPIGRRTLQDARTTPPTAVTALP